MHGDWPAGGFGAAGAGGGAPGRHAGQAASPVARGRERGGGRGAAGGRPGAGRPGRGSKWRAAASAPGPPTRVLPRRERHPCRDDTTLVPFPFLGHDVAHDAPTERGQPRRKVVQRRLRHFHFGMLLAVARLGLLPRPLAMLLSRLPLLAGTAGLQLGRALRGSPAYRARAGAPPPGPALPPGEGDGTRRASRPAIG